jgi:hypothetical protein
MGWKTYPRLRPLVLLGPGAAVGPSTGDGGCVCWCGGMLRCSNSDILLIFYCRDIPAIAGVSVWYTMHLRCRGGAWFRPGRAQRRLPRGRRQTLSQGLAQKRGHVRVGPEGTKAGNAPGVGEIPLVFGNANEIANGGIARPSPAQRRLGQLRRHAGAQKGANVAGRIDAVDGGQLGEIDGPIGGGRLGRGRRWPRPC